MLDQEQGYRTTFESGELSDLLNTHAANYRAGIGAKMGQTVVLAAQFLGGYVVALTQHWKLTLILSGMIPVLLAGGACTLCSISHSTKKVQLIYTRAAAILEESITNIRTIIAYGLEDTFHAKYVCACIV